MSTNYSSKLPIDPVIDSIKDHFKNAQNILIQATPGSGKTTRVPVALANIDPRLKIAVLEPRRLSAKIAAQRICEENQLTLGDRIGYHVKDENQSHSKSQIVFYTEALLAKKFFSDPILENFDAIIFDEFHERNLYTDFCLALCIRANQIREKLALKTRPLILMSATADLDAISKKIQPLQIIKVEQKVHPLEIEHFKSSIDAKNFVEDVSKILPEVLIHLPTDGHVLFFLPGRFEIDRVEDFLLTYFSRNQLPFEILQLHGSMSLNEQSKIFENYSLKRKFILSTNLAESSVTIPGVRTVIDSGLARISGFNPFTGTKTLSLKKISQASCIQRAGRAAREAPGKCIRLFSEADYLCRTSFEVPEIYRSSISQLILENARIEKTIQEKFGEVFSFYTPTAASTFLSLGWLDIPNQDIYEHSRLELQYIENLDEKGEVTQLGNITASLPLNPRLATLCELSRNTEYQELASWLALILDGAWFETRNNIRNLEKNYQHFLEQFKQKNANHNLQKFSHLWKQLHLKIFGREIDFNRFFTKNLDKFLFILCQTFPDKVAKFAKVNHFDKNKEIEYQICTGGSCILRDTNLHSPPEWIIILDGIKLDNKFKNDQKWTIQLYCEIQKENLELMEASRTNLISQKSKLDWNDSKIKIVQTSQIMYGCLNLKTQNKDLDNPTKESQEFFFKFLSNQQSILNKVFQDGELLWKNFINRLLLGIKLDLIPLKQIPVSITNNDISIVPNPEIWRSLFLQFISSKVLRLKDFEDYGFESFTKDFIGESNYQELETHLLNYWKPSAHSRKSFKISYNEDGSASVSAKIQDFFGLKDSPSLARGKIRLRLEFLGPHGRPLQISSDLNSFWNNSYPQLRKELMRRYPKHLWPEDPVAPKFS